MWGGALVFLLPFCVLMLWVSWTPVVRSWQVREVSPDPGGLPRWPIKALLLVNQADEFIIIAQFPDHIAEPRFVWRNQKDNFELCCVVHN